MNPATQPECNFFLGLPGVAPLQLYVENSGFSVNDVIWAEGDSVYHLLHPSANLDAFINGFKKGNYIVLDATTTISSFGVRIDDYYLTSDISVHADNRFIYPASFMEFLLKGNDTQQNYDFSGLGFDFTNYAEWAVGLSRKFSEELYIGARAKFLFGLANATARNTNFGLTMSPQEVSFDSEFDMFFSVIGLDAPDTLDSGSDFNYDFSLSSAMQNKGFGLDLGAHYSPIDRLMLSASLLDIGFIRWSGAKYSLSQNHDYVYHGVDEDNADSDNIGDEILDTLENMFTFTGNSTKYTTWLTGRVYLGGSYEITPSFNAGLLLHSPIIHGLLQPQITFHGNWQPSTVWSLSANYSLLNKSYAGFGIGTAFRLGPLNLYFMADQVPFSYNVIQTDGAGIPVPNTIRSMSFRIGLNLVFGCNKKKRMLKDKPLLYDDEYYYYY
jgi:hypothetical protein